LDEPIVRRVDGKCQLTAVPGSPRGQVAVVDLEKSNEKREKTRRETRGFEGLILFSHFS
jgi:hypothetical protein